MAETPARGSCATTLKLENNMASYYDNRAASSTVAASNTPETYLGQNLRGAHPRPTSGLKDELYVITRTEGAAPGDVRYWGRGLTSAEAAWCNKTAAHRAACLAAIADGQPCPAWA